MVNWDQDRGPQPTRFGESRLKNRVLSGLKNANAKRRAFWTQRTWTQALAPREVFNSQKTIAMRFLNASVLERKSLNRNLSWGFPLGNLLPKMRVLKHRVLERKRRPNANASVLGMQCFRTLRPGLKMPSSDIKFKNKLGGSGSPFKDPSCHTHERGEHARSAQPCQHYAEQPSNWVLIGPGVGFNSGWDR